MLLHHALRTESANEMLPLAHVASEGSDEPAHPHSLARDIAAHIHNESAYSPTRWLFIIHQRTPQQIRRKKCSKKRLVSRLNLSDQPAHPGSQLSLERMLHTKNENKKFYRQTCVCGSRQLQRGVGGLLLDGSSYQFFF